MRRQAEIAVENADIIIFLMDLITGVTADDREIAVNLRKSGKPVIPCVNKADEPGDPPPDFYEFYSLAFEEELSRYPVFTAPAPAICLTV